MPEDPPDATPDAAPGPDADSSQDGATPSDGARITGTIVSHASGSTYYAKMAIKQSNTLRVEACAVGRFFCSGNDWSRIVTKPQALITSRQTAAQPPS